LIAAPAAAAPPRAHAYTRGHATYFRLAPADALAVAGVCVREGLERCGDLITGDGGQFAVDCGRSGQAVARELRAQARRAARRDPRWFVVTRTENGGYPYTCAFAAERVAPELCAGERLSVADLAALPLVERLVTVVTRLFCIGGWSPALSDTDEDELTEED